MEADGIQRKGFKIKRNVANITEAVQRKDCDITPENLRGYTSFMRKSNIEHLNTIRPLVSLMR
jgi:hypothetical protein